MASHHLGSGLSRYRYPGPEFCGINGTRRDHRRGFQFHSARTRRDRTLIFPMIASPWKITLSPASSPLVLLDFGERVNDEIEWGISKINEVIALTRSAAPLLQNLDNRSYQIAFEIQRSQTTDLLNAAAILDELIAWGARDIAELKIERSGITAHYWKFTQAVVTAINGKGRTVGNFLRTTKVQITAAGLVKTTV